METYIEFLTHVVKMCYNQWHRKLLWIVFLRNLSCFCPYIFIALLYVQVKLYVELYVYLFALHSVHWISRCLPGDWSLSKLSAPHQILLNSPDLRYDCLGCDTVWNGWQVATSFLMNLSCQTTRRYVLEAAVYSVHSWGNAVVRLCLVFMCVRRLAKRDF